MIKAENAAPDEAVYPSNLSASLYELGDYVSSFQAICRAASKLSDREKESSLVQRLSTRLAKALSYGTREGTISAEMIENDVTTVEYLSSVAEKAETGQDIEAAWKEWRRVESEREAVSEGSAAARTRLSQLPIFKQAA